MCFQFKPIYENSEFVGDDGGGMGDGVQHNVMRWRDNVYNEKVWWNGRVFILIQKVCMCVWAGCIYAVQEVMYRMKWDEYVI